MPGIKLRPSMGIAATPRSVSDATRFTATTPHANSKGSRFAPPKASLGASQHPRVDQPRAHPPKINHLPNNWPETSLPEAGSPPSGGDDGPGKREQVYHETPQQKVARLRAQHRRAQEAQVSRFDRVIAVGRRFCDAAHRITVTGLIGFTGLAVLVTGYTAVDMWRINRARKAEFIELQLKLEADSLQAARLAYMTGTATEEQITLVDEANERDAGQAGKIFGMPNMLSKPQPLTSPWPEDKQEQFQQQPSLSAAVAWPASADTEVGPVGKQGQQEQQGVKKEGIWTWFKPTVKNRATIEGQDTSSGGTTIQFIGERAREAFAKERENQLNGGLLDRVGFGAESPAEEQPRAGKE